MAKFVASNPDWLKVEAVEYIYSVSSCISSDFADYINYWQHNGFWLFDSPTIIEGIAAKEDLNLSNTCLFYYQVYELEYDNNKHQWQTFQPETSFKTEVLIPDKVQLRGFDVVTFSNGTSPECSPLSCNSLATDLPVNKYCLLDSLEIAKKALLEDLFNNCEPGPYRIFAVYTVK